MRWMLLLLLCGCKKPVDVTPLSNEDETIRKNEEDLLLQRGTLQRERKKISDARNELLERRKQAGKDSASLASIDDEEHKLNTSEKELTQKESQLSTQLDDLLKMRGELVKKV